MSKSKGSRCGYRIVRDRTSAVLVATGSVMANAARQVQLDMKLGASHFHQNKPNKVVLRLKDPSDEQEVHRVMEKALASI